MIEYEENANSKSALKDPNMQSGKKRGLSTAPQRRHGIRNLPTLVWPVPARRRNLWSDVYVCPSQMQLLFHRLQKGPDKSP